MTTEEREKALHEARLARIAQSRHDLHELLVSRDLIRKEGMRAVEEQKIAAITNELTN